MLTERRLPSYFSCNPAVLDETRFEEHMRAGLDYVKFSIESTDDERFKQIRGHVRTSLSRSQ
jgi:molybdenum cofactor biosynthesis enzyme MoaA